MMHSNIKQIAIKSGHSQPIFARSTELLNFQNRLRPGLRDDVTALSHLRISAIGLKFSGMMHSTMKQIST